MNRRQLQTLYRQLLSQYGPQNWWPADTPFEVMVGAILTQNTAWTNVERAISNLQRENLLEAELISRCSTPRLAQFLRPSGYFNIKAERLKQFCDWYVEMGGYERLKHQSTRGLRHRLLAVKGVGPETADDMLLYAFNRAVFVIDAYTRRLFSRLGWIEGNEPYEVLRLDIERAMGKNAKQYNEYHALIVKHGKDVCRPKPLCRGCALNASCSYPHQEITSRA
jgi:endonuclease-3 related protein